MVNANSGAVAEGDLEIGRVFGLNAALAPVNSSGRFSGTHILTFTNWDNSAAQLRIVAADQDQKLRFTVDPATVHVPLGASVVARLKVQPRRRMIRGAQVRLPFRVTGKPDPPHPGGPPAIGPYGDPRRPAVDGTFTQKPVLARAVVGALALLLVAGGGAAAFAVNEARKGDPAPTPTPEPDPVLPGPKAPALTATVVHPTTIQLTWNKQPVDEYVLILHTEGKSEKLHNALQKRELPGLQPDKEYCYELEALRNGKTKRSNKVCKTTPPEEVEATESPGPDDSSPPAVTKEDFGSDWIAWLATFPEEATAESRARDALKGYQDSGIATGMLLSSDYPDMGVPTPSYIVYVRAPTQAEAENTCRQADPDPPGGCVTRQPSVRPLVVR